VKIRDDERPRERLLVYVANGYHHVIAPRTVSTIGDLQFPPPIVALLKFAPHLITSPLRECRMPAIQRTFNLIPENLSNATSKPPMTSKAAKKAYLKANRGPKVNRAEQRRLEKEELEKQKKEYEKERNAARAKVLREKKAAKLAEEKEQRRKLGIPEPNRFVRASQPTISMFARRGGKRTWQETGMDDIAEDSEDATEEEALQPMEIPEPSAKRAAVEQDSDDEFGCFLSMSQASDLLNMIYSSSVSVSQNKETSRPSSESGNKNPRQLSAAPALSQTEIPEDKDSPQASQHSRLLYSATAVSKAAKEALAKKVPVRQNSQELSQPNAQPSFDEIPFNYKPLRESTTTQLQSEAAEAEAVSDPVSYTQVLQTCAEVVAADKCSNAKASSQIFNGRASDRHAYHSPEKVIPILKPSLPRSLARLPSSQAARLLNNSQNIPVDPTVAKPRFRKPNMSMPPPPKPTKFTKPRYSITPHSSNSSVPRKLGREILQHTEDLPPTATQLFLENNLDDFLPSPSQEVKELLDDIEDDFPSNTQVASEISPFRPTLCFKPRIDVVDDSFGDLFCTQDFAMSSQELLEITTPSRPPPTRPINKKLAAAPVPAKQHKATQPRLPLQRSSGNIARPIRSSNASRSDNAPKHQSASVSKGPPNSVKNTPGALPIVCGTKTHAVHSHVEVVKHDSQKISRAREMPPSVPPKIPLDPKPKRRFFKEKEEDLFQAAIYESRKSECDRMAQEKAKEANAKVKETIPAPLKRNDRSLQRVLSNATDYDDDDFISSQDLLALC
jgi:hypothetical protein